MITTKKIQEKLSMAIDNSNLTQSEIARLCNIQPTQICSYKKGRKMPSLETFANLCDILLLDANEILGLNTFNKKK